MAGLFVVATPSGGTVALTAATAKTIFQVVAPTNQCVQLKSFIICFQDTTTTDTPVQIQLLKQTAVIGGTPTSLSGNQLAKKDPARAETVQTVVQVYGSLPTEPASSLVLRNWAIHPQTGEVYIYPLGDELIIPGGERRGFVVTAAQSQTCLWTLELEE